MGRIWSMKNLVNSERFSVSLSVHENRTNYICLTVIVVFSFFYCFLADRTRDFKGYTRWDLIYMGNRTSDDLRVVPRRRI